MPTTRSKAKHDKELNERTGEANHHDDSEYQAPVTQNSIMNLTDSPMHPTNSVLSETDNFVPRSHTCSTSIPTDPIISLPLTLPLPTQSSGHIRPVDNPIHMQHVISKDSKSLAPNLFDQDREFCAAEFSSHSMTDQSSIESHFLEQELLIEEEVVKLRKKRLMLDRMRNKARLGEKIEEHVLQRPSPPAATGAFDPEQNRLNTIEGLLSKLMVGADLPKIEVDPFSGSPGEFVCFINAFNTHIANRVTDPSQRLAYLIHYCHGIAKDAIKHCVLLPKDTCYTIAIEILKGQFGRPNQVIEAVTRDIFEGPLIRAEDLDALQSLASQMKGCSITLSQLGREADLNCSVNLLRILKRLPRTFQVKWAEFADSMMTVGRTPTFDDLVGLIERRVAVLSTEYGQLTFERNRPERSNLNKNYRIAAVYRNQIKGVCFICGGNHEPDTCTAFKALSVNDRWSALRDNKRCFKCLKANHRSNECYSKTHCGHSGCNKPHHPLLHHDGKREVDIEENSNRVCSSSCSNDGGVQLGFVPVKLIGPRGSIETYAFVDNGSDCTLVGNRIAEELGLALRPYSLSVSTLHGSKTMPCSRADLKLQSITEPLEVDLKSVFVVDKLPVDRINERSCDLQKWPHLKDLPFTCLNNAQVGVLIGCDVPEAHWVTEQRVGSRTQPFASKSPLGWVIWGPTDGNPPTTSRVNAIIRGTDSLQNMITQLYDADFADIGDPEELRYSIEDKQAIELVKASARMNEGHYELAAPWKQGDLILPDNRELAEKRLTGLKHRLARDSDLKLKYDANMNDHIKKGHVRLAVGNTRRWFLPHHPVLNPRKPDKLRVVFDCAASYKGLSLNDALLQGPNWTNTLTGVLLRFRRYPIALSADIREMFLQVRLAESDKWAFSFLWWPDGHLNNPPKVYEWNVHPFGATSSPFCANYALRRTAEDNRDKFKHATVTAIFRDFYVDDCLTSVQTLEDARSLATELRDILKLGGFELVKWISNVEPALSDVPKSDRACDPIDLLQSDYCQRTLGIQWNVSRDVFKFRTILPSTSLTRRKLLSYIASVYDPLGFIAPILLPGRLLFQELHKEGIGWDAPLPDSYSRQYTDWLAGLQSLETIEIQRSIMLRHESKTNPELHMFSDASELGYGAVGYLRQVRSDNSIHCTFLMGKCRVAPLKFTTIPRLELVAALISAKLMTHLANELDIETSDVTLWTDSAIVLRYLANTSTRFATFVANRVRRIQELTASCQWRHVPSNENPADVASRGIQFTSHPKMDLWLYGPAFLRQPESRWPKIHFDRFPSADGLELKRTTMAIVKANHCEWLHELSMRCPTWMRMLRLVAWLTRFRTYILLKHSSRQNISIQLGAIKANEMEHAATDVVHLVQNENFRKERTVLRNGEVSNYATELRRLRPIERNGTLCLGGRVASQGEALQILPARSRITDLIIEHYHRLSAHSGASYVLAAVRRKYWIIKGMAAVRRIILNCAKCRLLQAPFCSQVMAPLPLCRIQSGTYPFRYCGLDYFGPFRVKFGRSEHKRFGCLFTCTQIRAIHIEVAHSLSTDSFLMALNRFISRRGTPEVIYSDNGSNFVGAEAELKCLLGSLDQERVIEGLQVHSIDWHFNPPSASHRGGIWERMIRTVRKTLSHLVREQVVTEEVLLTSLAEAERIINDRPLVPVYDDPDQPSVIRPSDLLLLRPNSGLTNDDIPIRERYTKGWRQAQHLAHIFWKRWRRDYLPNLQPTHRWHTPRRDIRQGDLVLLYKPDLPRGYWPKGIVTEVYPGEDSHVRKVSVRVNDKHVLRDVRSLCLLEGVEI